LDEKHCAPLWGDGGLTSDFVLGVSWLLAQDIYQLPTSFLEVQPLQLAQVTDGNRISQNDVRWNGLRYWSRYLGFATGDSAAFQIDPTSAIRDQLPAIFESRKELPAKDFLQALCARLPVLDFGRFRVEVEDKLNPAKWRRPSDGHLSMSLSLALRRLDLDHVLSLTGRADAGTSFRLTGRGFRSWVAFESVVWSGGKK